MTELVDYVTIPKDIFEKLNGKVDNIPLAFSLYFYFLITNNRRNRVTTTMKIISNDLRIKDARTCKKLFPLLCGLRECNYIDHNLAQYNQDTMFNISVNEHNSSIRIERVNEEILFLPDKNRFIFLAVHSYLKMNSFSDTYSTITRIPYEPIAKNLEINPSTVGTALGELERLGLIKVIRGIFNSAKGKNECNIYKYYPFDKRVEYKERKKKQEGVANSKWEIPNPQLALYELEKQCIEDIYAITTNQDYYPAMFIGLYSLFFKYISNQHIFKIKEAKQIDDLIERFWGIADLEGKLLILDIAGANIRLQSLLLQFVENTSIPLLILTETDNIIPPLLGRMKFIYKVIGDCIDSFLSTSPQTYFLNKMAINRHDNYKVDELINRISNGSTYHNLKICNPWR